MSRKVTAQEEQLASIGRQIIILEEEASQCELQARSAVGRGNHLLAKSLREQVANKQQRVIELTVQRDEIENA